MSVKHALLAGLSSGPAYGYQLKTDFERRTGSAWPLNIGQVYTTLDRLVRDGLATALEEPDPDGRTRYGITVAGSVELHRWLADPIEVTSPPRQDLAIKLALAVTMPAVDVAGLVQTQRSATMRTLQHYTVAKRQADPDDVAWLLVVELMIFTAEAELRWLDHCEGLALRHASHRPDIPTDGDDAVVSATDRAGVRR